MLDILVRGPGLLKTGPFPQTLLRSPLLPLSPTHPPTSLPPPSPIQLRPLPLIHVNPFSHHPPFPHHITPPPGKVVGCQTLLSWVSAHADSCCLPQAPAQQGEQQQPAAAAAVAAVPAPQQQRPAASHSLAHPPEV